MSDYFVMYLPIRCRNNHLIQTFHSNTNQPYDCRILWDQLLDKGPMHAVSVVPRVGGCVYVRSISAKNVTRL